MRPPPIIVILSALILSICGNSSRPQWQGAGLAENNLVIWYDQNSLRKTPTARYLNFEFKVWEGEVLQYGTAEFKCSERTFRMINVMHVEQQRDRSVPDEKDYTVIRPNSPMERMFDYACRPWWK